jgi:HEPN domain-containing protein
MPPEHPDLNDPSLWFDYAKSDLALARVGKFPEVRLGALCFLCQQAAEKALKAVLLRHKVEFPPTHNLKKLFNLLPPPISAPPDVMESIDLVEFVLKGRYPLEFLDIQQEEYEKSLMMADRVLRWAEKALE